MEREEPGESRKFDLGKALAPAIVDVPGIGQAALDVRTAGFLRWFDDGRRAGRWDDPQDFTRALLVERSVAASGVELIAPEAVDRLAPEQVEAAAAIIIRESGSSFIPATAATENSGADESEIDVTGTADDPTDGSEAARLLQRVVAYSDYHRQQSRRFLETVKRAGAAADILRGAGALSSILKVNERLGSGILSHQVLRQADALPSILKMQSSLASGLIRPEMRKSALAAERQLSILKIGETLASSSLFEGHRRLAEQLASRSSPLQQVQEAMRGIVGISAWRTAEERARLFAGRAQWAEIVNKQLRLGLPATLFSSLATQLAAGGLAEAVATRYATMIRPGFEITATAALEGLAAPGAVAELLRRYEEEPQAPIFGAVHEAVTRLDAEEDTPDGFLELFDVAWSAILRAISTTPDLIRNPAFVAWLSLLVAAAGVSLVAYQTFGPPSVEVTKRLDESNAQLRSIHSQLEADRQRNEAARHIRHVHAVVNLRTEPSGESQLIRLVYPDQWIRLIETKGDWALVEVFDYGSDAAVTGWISRRYLRSNPA